MKNPNQIRPLRVVLKRGSKASKSYYAVAGMPGAKKAAKIIKRKDRAPGFPSTPSQNLVYKGGKTIRNLTFTNFYIGGNASWNASDIQNIDLALDQAMNDRYLNNVMRQYFSNKPIAAHFKPSKILDGSKPQKFTEDDAIALITSLYKNKMLKGFRFTDTVFNMVLPKGTVLTDDKSSSEKKRLEKLKKRKPFIPEEEDTSLEGLGGYHGSVHVNSKITIYYAVGVYSYTMSNGKDNGIVAFDKSWKNIVATFYHELCEARTDADVDDAIATNNSKYCGWISKQGSECGDGPMEEANNLSDVMQEVPLANGQGTVPIQFQYSNAVNGPKGPIKALHSL